MRNLIILVFMFIISNAAIADTYTYFKGSQLIQSNQSIISSGGTTSLTATSEMKTVVTGTLSHTIKLPDTSLLLTGMSYQIINKSTQSITVKDFSDSTLDVLSTETDKTYVLFAGPTWYSSSGASGGSKILEGSSPIVITQDAITATFSLDSTKTRTYAGSAQNPSITDNGGGNITVDSLQVNLWSTSTFDGDANTYTVGPLTATLTDLATNYIIADYNAGSPIMRVTTNVNEITESNIIPIYTIYRSGTMLHTLGWDTLGKGLANKVHQSIVKTQRYRRESGLALSESGTRNVNLTSGELRVGANPISLSSIASLTDNIYYFLRTAPSAWTMQSVTQYNNTDYFNGTTTASLTTNRYGVNWLYRGVESQKHLYMVLGEGDYTLAQAQAAQPPVSLPANITSHGLLVGRIIVQKGASIATQIDSAFAIAFTQSAAAIHNDLSSLQGGQAGEYYHTTANQNTAISTLSSSGSLVTTTADFKTNASLAVTGTASIGSSLAVTGTTTIESGIFNFKAVTATPTHTSGYAKIFSKDDLLYYQNPTTGANTQIGAATSSNLNYEYDISSQLTGSFSSISSAYAQVEKMAGGTYKIDFQIRALWTGASRTSAQVTLASASPRANTSISCTPLTGVSTNNERIQTDGVIRCDHNTSTTDYYYFSGTFIQTTKPSWATNTP